MSAGGGLPVCALLHNNLTRAAYRRSHPGTLAVQHSHDPLPGERAGIQADDLGYARDELGAFVDAPREGLELVVRRTEQHALRRSMGEIRAGQMMPRDLIPVRPQSGATLLRGGLRSRGSRAPRRIVWAAGAMQNACQWVK